MKYPILISAIFITLSVTAQKNFIANLDTTVNTMNPYIQQYTAATFWQQSFVEEAIDVNQPNIELLEATIFFEINRYRVAKKKRALIYHSKLDKLAENYANYYSSRVLNNRRRATKLFNKSIAKASRAIGFYGGFKAFIFSVNYLLKHRKGSSIFTKTVEGERKFYIGKEKRVKKNAKKANLTPVPTLTYVEWAKKTRKRWFDNRTLTDLGFTQLGCAIQVIDKNAKAVPRIKVMAILGGYRLQKLSIGK